MFSALTWSRTKHELIFTSAHRATEGPSAAHITNRDSVEMQSAIGTNISKNTHHKRSRIKTGWIRLFQFFGNFSACLCVWLRKKGGNCLKKIPYTAFFLSLCFTLFSLAPITVCHSRCRRRCCCCLLMVKALFAIFSISSGLNI